MTQRYRFGQAYANSEPDDYVVSDLPPDTRQSVRVVATQQVTSEDDYAVSDLPPDTKQSVRIVAAQQAASEDDYVVSDLPSDTRQSVQVAAAQGMRCPCARQQDTPEPSQAEVPAETLTEAPVRPPPNNTMITGVLKALDYADILDPSAVAEQQLEDLSPQLPLDYQEIYRIMREVAVPYSGDALYSAVSRNLEYTTQGNPAYQQRQFGLGFGFLLFSQASSHLGSLLQIMQRREPELFGEIFAPHAEQLLTTLNAATAEERLQLVGDVPLWSDSWVEKFRRAGEVPAFQAAQNEEAIENIFYPMLPIAYDLGFVTDRSLAMVFDRVLTHGLGAGLRRVVAASGILATGVQRAVGLELLEFQQLADFQASISDLPQSGVFDVETYAAMVNSLRAASLVPLPTTRELQQRLINQAQNGSKIRLQRLADLSSFDDIVYALS